MTTIWTDLALTLADSYADAPDETCREHARNNLEAYLDSVAARVRELGERSTLLQRYTLEMTGDGHHMVESKFGAWVRYLDVTHHLLGEVE